MKEKGPLWVMFFNASVFPTDTVFFYYQIADKKEKRISLQEFRKIKTVSVTQLIDLALKCLPPGNRSRYKFIFAEPDGKNIRLTDMNVWLPLKPRNTTTVETIKGTEN